MSENENKIVQSMAEAIADLPDAKRQYFVGFAEGVAAMAEQVKGERQKNEGL